MPNVREQESDPWFSLLPDNSFTRDVPEMCLTPQSMVQSEDICSILELVRNEVSGPCLDPLSQNPHFSQTLEICKHFTVGETRELLSI